VAAITSYSTLDTEVANRTGRSDLSASLEFACQMGQKRIVRDLLNKGATVGEQTVAVITTVAGTPTVALPTSFISPISMSFRAPYADTLPIVTIEQIQRMSGPFTSFPTAYAIYGSNLYFGPNPNAAYGFDFFYFAEPLLLSASNQTNWFITNAPDLIFYAVLTQLSDAVRDDKKIADYEAAYQGCIQQIATAQARFQYGGGPPKMAGLGTINKGFNIITNSR